MAIKGFWFPFGPGGTSFPAEAEDDDLIKASLIQIVTTGYGERIMRPEFGCNAFNYVFENDDEILHVIIEREVRSSVTRWEPRVKIEGVLVESNQNQDPGLITVTLIYTVLNTNKTAALTVQGGV